VHGGGGAPLYNTLGPRATPDHTIMYGETRLGYAVVRIDGPKATVEIKGIGGESLDSFSYGDSVAPECSRPTDCGPAPPFGCAGGGWECARSSCRYACAPGSGSLINCVTDRACQTQIGATCAGTVACEHPSINPLSWFCGCTLPPECSDASDCAGRPSPVPGCTGTWGCVDQLCEFTTGICTPVPDAGPPDASNDADATAAAEDARAADASPVGFDDATSAMPPTADAGLVADASLSVDATGPAAPSSGCGCHVSGGREQGLWALGALGLLLARRHRRVGPPASGSSAH